MPEVYAMKAELDMKLLMIQMLTPGKKWKPNIFAIPKYKAGIMNRNIL